MASLTLRPQGVPTLAQLLAGRQNNLNLIRMIAASAVLVSHSYPIALGEGTPEPLEHLTGLTLGGHAVAVFWDCQEFRVWAGG